MISAICIPFITHFVLEDQIDHHDEVPVKYHMEGDMAPRKTHKRVPHDVGNPCKIILLAAWDSQRESD